MLRLSDIHKQYKTDSYTVDALKGISLGFRKNEFVSILGASGCGKTTLLKLIINYLKPLNIVQLMIIDLLFLKIAFKS